MSHEATAWAVRQRGLKPTTKVVLWHLADRHNPDLGCFPSQERLAEDVEISRSTLNEHLTLLEERGFIRRQVRMNPKTRRQMSTRYILAFERDFSLDDAVPCPESRHGETEKPCPDSGHGAVSEKPAEPCPENRKSRVRNPDSNLVREPLREPLAPARANADAETPRDHLSPAAAGDEAGEKADAPQSDLDRLATLQSKMVLEGRSYAANIVKLATARRMLDLALVSTEQLRAVGVQF